MTKKYSHVDELTALYFLVNAMNGGGDVGRSFPRSDAEDLSRGLKFIPGEVTIARRMGKRVQFIQDCPNRCCWYWLFPDGSRTYYWERWNWEQIALQNNTELQETEWGSKTGDAGTCPLCGNPHTNGGRIDRYGNQRES